MGCGASSQKDQSNVPAAAYAPKAELTTPENAGEKDAQVNDELAHVSELTGKEVTELTGKQGHHEKGTRSRRHSKNHAPSQSAKLESLIAEGEAAPPCDVFEENTIVPLPPRDPKYVSGVPSVDGDEITACFDGGLLYKIVKDNKWFFYNDTPNFEMLVAFTFGKNSRLEALGTTELKQGSDGEWIATVMCYPTETIPFVTGEVAGFKSKIKALPLSETHLQHAAAVNGEVIKREMEAMPPVHEHDEDADILRKCVEHGTPFVDARFPPCQESVAAGAKIAMKTVPWARPSMFLPESLVEQERLFRQEISPMNVRRGDLGDSWVMCAMAVLADHPEILRSLFRHPQSPELTAKERAVGAYRVTLNRNGWWRNVVVDNYLPVVGSLPKYAKSFNDPCEMWVSILEKAFAKTYGSYANIMAGDPLAALRAVTGFPTSRYDELLATDGSHQTCELLKRLEQYRRFGCEIVMNTHVKKGKNPQVDEAFKTAGLLMGHAYAVKDIHYFEAEDVGLVCLNNPWVKGVKWPHSWGLDDPLWSEYPHIAEVCKPHAASAEGSFWMNWRDASKYFAGCGVLFSRYTCTDYRVRGEFKKEIPGVALMIHVTKPTYVAFTLSLEDSRDGVTEEPKPLMLSLCSGDGSLETVDVVANSNLDADFPSAFFSFMQCKDLGMLCMLTPEKSPYILLPRIMSTAEKPHSYVMGVISEEKVGSEEFKVDFVSVPEHSPAYTNAASFSTAGMAAVETLYQIKRPGCGFPVTYRGERIA